MSAEVRVFSKAVQCKQCGIEFPPNTPRGERHKHAYACKGVSAVTSSTSKLKLGDIGDEKETQKKSSSGRLMRKSASRARKAMVVYLGGNDSDPSTSPADNTSEENEDYIGDDTDNDPDFKSVLSGDEDGSFGGNDKASDEDTEEYEADNDDDWDAEKSDVVSEKLDESTDPATVDESSVSTLAYNRMKLTIHSHRSVFERFVTYQNLWHKVFHKYEIGLHYYTYFLLERLKQIKSPHVFTTVHEDSTNWVEAGASELKYDSMFPQQSAWTALPPSDYAAYLPRCTQSMQFTVSLGKFNGKKMVADIETPKKSLGLFEADPVGGVAFTGGLIRAISWCPTVPRNPNQFLAVSTYSSPEVTQAYSHIHAGPGLIQIWRCGQLSFTRDQSEPSLTLHLGLAHNWGHVIALRWLPVPLSAGRHYDNNTRAPLMGHLAAACSDGYVRIFPVPLHPQSEGEPMDTSESGEESRGYPIYTLNESSVLKLGIGLVYKQDVRHRYGFPRCLCWRPENPNIIAAGYTTGYVALFDVSSLSHLRYTSEDQYISPIRCQRLLDSPVHAVQLHPRTSKILIVTGMNRLIRVWNLADPGTFQVSWFPSLSGMIREFVWPGRGDIFVSAEDDSYGHNDPHVLTFMAQNPINTRVRGASLKSAAMSMNFGDLVNTAAYGTTSGTIGMIGFNFPVSFPKKSKTVPEDNIWTSQQLNLVPVESPSEENPCDCPNNGLTCIHKISQNYTLNISEVPDERKKGPLDVKLFPVCSINEVCINPNPSSCNWLAYGTTSGILRVTYENKLFQSGMQKVFDDPPTVTSADSCYVITKPVIAHRILNRNSNRPDHSIVTDNDGAPCKKLGRPLKENPRFKRRAPTVSNQNSKMKQPSIVKENIVSNVSVLDASDSTAENASICTEPMSADEMPEHILMTHDEISRELNLTMRGRGRGRARGKSMFITKEHKIKPPSIDPIIKSKPIQEFKKLTIADLLRLPINAGGEKLSFSGQNKTQNTTPMQVNTSDRSHSEATSFVSKFSESLHVSQQSPVLLQNNSATKSAESLCASQDSSLLSVIKSENLCVIRPDHAVLPKLQLVSPDLKNDSSTSQVEHEDKVIRQNMNVTTAINSQACSENEIYPIKDDVKSHSPDEMTFQNKDDIESHQCLDDMTLQNKADIESRPQINERTLQNDGESQQSTYTVGLVCQVSSPVSNVTNILHLLSESQSSRKKNSILSENIVKEVDVSKSVDSVVRDETTNIDSILKAKCNVSSSEGTIVNNPANSISPKKRGRKPKSAEIPSKVQKKILITNAIPDITTEGIAQRLDEVFMHCLKPASNDVPPNDNPEKDLQNMSKVSSSFQDTEKNYKTSPKKAPLDSPTKKRSPVKIAVAMLDDQHVTQEICSLASKKRVDSSDKLLSETDLCVGTQLEIMQHEPCDTSIKQTTESTFQHNMETNNVSVETPLLLTETQIATIQSSPRIPSPVQLLKDNTSLAEASTVGDPDTKSPIKKGKQTKVAEKQMDENSPSKKLTKSPERNTEPKKPSHVSPIVIDKLVESIEASVKNAKLKKLESSSISSSSLCSTPKTAINKQKNDKSSKISSRRHSSRTIELNSLQKSEAGISDNQSLTTSSEKPKRARLSKNAIFSPKSVVEGNLKATKDVNKIDVVSSSNVESAKLKSRRSSSKTTHSNENEKETDVDQTSLVSTATVRSRRSRRNSEVSSESTVSNVPSTRRSSRFSEMNESSVVTDVPVIAQQPQKSISAIKCSSEKSNKLNANTVEASSAKIPLISPLNKKTVNSKGVSKTPSELITKSTAEVKSASESKSMKQKNAATTENVTTPKQSTNLSKWIEVEWLIGKWSGVIHTIKRSNIVEPNIVVGRTYNVTWGKKSSKKKKMYQCKLLAFLDTNDSKIIDHSDLSSMECIKSTSSSQQIKKQDTIDEHLVTASKSKISARETEPILEEGNLKNTKIPDSDSKIVLNSSDEKTPSIDKVTESNKSSKKRKLSLDVQSTDRKTPAKKIKETTPVVEASSSTKKKNVPKVPMTKTPQSSLKIISKFSSKTLQRRSAPNKSIKTAFVARRKSTK